MHVNGSLPVTWAGNSSLPSLSELVIGFTDVTSKLPPEWGSPTAFQNVASLTIVQSSITGSVSFRISAVAGIAVA